MESIDHPEKTNEELVDSSCVCPTSTQFQGNAEDSPIDDYSALVHEETINLDQNPLMSNHSSKVKHRVYNISSVSKKQRIMHDNNCVTSFTFDRTLALIRLWPQDIARKRR